MMAFMFFCVPFVQALQHQWFSYYWVGIVLQHVFQTLYLGTAIWWGYHRHWYWVQSGFLVLRELTYGESPTPLAELIPVDALSSLMKVDYHYEFWKARLTTATDALVHGSQRHALHRLLPTAR